MGKWNRRYIPSRKRYRHYDYDDPIPTFEDYPDVSDADNYNAPQWEIDYCKSVRVPWRKVLATKKYSYCYPNVREWDDSSGEEALNNAKQRYWSTINGLQCETPLPDPNMYIDEVDWNAASDPELMADLDLLYYDPNREHKNTRKLATVEDIGIDRPGSDNQWEVNHTRGDGLLVDGWGFGVDSKNVEKGSPWEQNCDRPVDSWNNCALESGNNSWDWRVDSQNTKNNNAWKQNYDQPVDSWNNTARGSGNNSWDRRVESQHMKKGSSWEQHWDRPVDSWNNCAWESGNNSWDRRVDSQKTKKSNAWEQNYDQPINSGWGSGNNSWDRGVDLQKQTNWGRNCDQVVDSWNSRTCEPGNNSWGLNEKIRKPCTSTNRNQRFGNSSANPWDKLPVKGRWRQGESNSWNPNPRDQDLRLTNHRNFRENKRSADANDRGWRDRDDRSRARRWNGGGSSHFDNNGDRRGFRGNNG